MAPNNARPLKIYVDFTPVPEVMELLRKGIKGHELLFPEKPSTSVLAQAEPDERFFEADVMLGQPHPEQVAQSNHLNWIHVSSSGITRYDNPQFRQTVAWLGIQVTNSASVYNDACAAHTLAFILAAARQLPLALASNCSNGSDAWNSIRSACMPLENQSAIIVGYGAIGKRLAELLAPFHMDLVAYRRKPRGDEGIPVIGPDELRDSLSRADHVINILPDSEQTHHFFDTGRFGELKPGAVFYNIGRGTTVDQKALLAALEYGNLKTAWLDVTDPEPLPDDHALRQHPRCHITPHTAGGHFQESRTLIRHFLTNFSRYLDGQELLDRVM